MKRRKFPTNIIGGANGYLSARR